MRGKVLVPHMGPGDLCIITVTTSSSVDSIGRIGPEDFVGQFKGVVTAAKHGSGGIEAKFEDRRITQNPDLAIRQYDDREPPFAYTVMPRYRMQSLTGSTALEVGQRCVVHIEDFAQQGRLCENPGLSPEEVRECFPADMVGIWEARVIQTCAQGQEVGAMAPVYPIAVILIDERIRDHENPDDAALDADGDRTRSLLLSVERPVHSAGERLLETVRLLVDTRIDFDAIDLGIPRHQATCLANSPKLVLASATQDNFHLFLRDSQTVEATNFEPKCQSQKPSTSSVHKVFLTVF